MAKQAISPGKRRVLSQGFIDKGLLYRWQRFAFMVGLILVVTAKTELGHCCNQLIINF